MTRYTFSFAALTTLALLAAPVFTAQAFFENEQAENCTVTYSHAQACYDGVGGDGNAAHNCIGQMTPQSAAEAAAALNCAFVNNEHASHI